MKALTIKQPWLWCITDGTKRVENRTWKPPYEIIGQRIALHAAKAKDHPGLVVARDIDPLVPHFDSLPMGAIVATAILVGYVVVEQKPNSVERMVEASKNAVHYAYRQDPWFFGPVGWLLDDIRKLPQPIPCKGALGLWNVPTEIEVTA